MEKSKMIEQFLKEQFPKVAEALLPVWDIYPELKEQIFSSYQEFADQQQISKDVAEKILKVRDAFVERDPSEAWHWLYSIASPNYDKKEPWEELEMIAGRNPTPPLPEKPTT